MEQQRRDRVDELLERLRQIDGIVSAESDDFDSAAVVIFVELQCADTIEGRPKEFSRPLRAIKKDIESVIAPISFQFLDQPRKIRRYMGRVYGLDEWLDDGYSRSYIKFCVFV